KEMKEAGWDARVLFDDNLIRAELQVNREGHVGFVYDIRLVSQPVPGFVTAGGASTVMKEENYYRAEVFLRRGGRSYDVFGYDEDDIIRDILDQFENYLHFLDLTPGKLPWEMGEHDDLLHPPEDDEGKTEK
ncbi:MAG: choline transporter, partial [Alcanivorax sp.]